MNRKMADSAKVLQVSEQFGLFIDSDKKPMLKYSLCKNLRKGDSLNDLRKASFDELIKIFQQCHDEIWEGGKRDPATAFDEFSKVLMTKIYDERFTIVGNEYQFQIKHNEKKSDTAKKVRTLYRQVQEKNSNVFKADIKLPDEIIYGIVKYIQEISIRSTDLDIKGRAFEQFLGKIFRDEYGQYFTPRNVVKFMVEFLDPGENDIIIDPACGSGGFLLHCMTHVIDQISIKYREDKDSINRIGWEFSHKQIFGIEINDRIARIAMMDMIMHEDGHSNIECNNALSNYSIFDAKRDIQPDKYSMIFTNPPFGSIIRDKDILCNFDLNKGKDCQKTEILFIERCLELLKIGGKLGIVLPDSILTNSSLQYVRDYILTKARILAVISLPQHAFIPSGAMVKASLLFLEKKGKKIDDYNVFLATAKHIGYDSRCQEDSNELSEILNDWKNYLKERHISKNAFIVREKDLEKTFSPKSFVFYSNNKQKKMKTLNELCDGIIFTGRTPARNLYTHEGHKILKVRDLTGKGIDWTNNERAFISTEFFLRNQNIKLQINDIVFITAAHHPKYIGEKVDIIDYIHPKYKNGVTCSAELMILRVDPKQIDPYYVLLFLKTNDGYNAIQSCIRGQTAHIYPKDIKNIKIPIPTKGDLSKIKKSMENLKICLNKKSLVEEQYLNTLKNLLNTMETTN